MRKHDPKQATNGQSASGICALDGPITFDTHMAIREMIAMAIGRHSQLVVDWRAIEVLDSSALALIFFSQRLAASEQTIIRHIELPAALNALAELYGVDAFLNP